MEIKKTLEDYPEISFIDNKTLEEVQTELLNDYNSKLQELTGKEDEQELSEASPIRTILYAASLQLYQLYQYVDYMGKQNFLKYATGNYLENLGALKGITRGEGTAAITTIRFISNAGVNITIPMGTLITAGDDVYFYTEEVAELSKDKGYVDVQAVCDHVGTVGNDYKVGMINQLVNSIPFVEAAANITESQKGTDGEEDSSLAERIYYAPESYSTAGPEGSYLFWVKEADSTITDVKVTSPSPTEVNIRYIKENGELPTEEECEYILNFLQKDKDKIPTTDLVSVEAPGVVEYEVDVTYYINKSDMNKANTISEAVESAVQSYVEWQKNKIGKDINPSYLISKIITAGAKRAEIAQPFFTKIEETDIAIPSGINIVYGGIEDD